MRTTCILTLHAEHWDGEQPGTTWHGRHILSGILQQLICGSSMQHGLGQCCLGTGVGDVIGAGRSANMEAPEFLRVAFSVQVVMAVMCC
jgi:hypothetical protein